MESDDCSRTAPARDVIALEGPAEALACEHLRRCALADALDDLLRRQRGVLVPLALRTLSARAFPRSELAALLTAIRRHDAEENALLHWLARHPWPRARRPED